MKTYGNSVSPGVKTEIQSTLPGIELWGHSIVLDGDSGIKCQMCDKSEELPELLEMSSGFREVVYKMYILGKFRSDSCDPDPESIEDMLNGVDKKDWPDKSRHQIKTNNMYWSGNAGPTTTTNSANADSVDMYIPKGHKLMMGGTPYTYYGNGSWFDEDNHILFATVDLIEKHGKEAKVHLPPEVVKEKEAELKSRKQTMQQQSLDKVGIGDVQDDADRGVDSLQDKSVGVVDGSSSVNIDGGVDDDRDKSAAERFAEKVREGRNQFIGR